MKKLLQSLSLRPDTRQLRRKLLFRSTKVRRRPTFKIDFVPAEVDTRDEPSKTSSLGDNALEQFKLWRIVELGRCLVPVESEMDLTV